MEKSNQHRLLRRQLKKYKVSPEDEAKFGDFINAINKAYESSDKDILHLENVLEVNSRELYKANQILKQDNKIKTQEAIEAKKNLDKVMANVDDIIFEVDKLGNFTYLNSAWNKYGEEEAQESLGKNFMEFAGNIKFFDTSILDAIEKREFIENDFSSTFSKQKKNGDILWWEMTVRVLKNVEGKIQGAIGSLVDITELKNSESQLIEASKTKSRFLSTMSHEIRTPLNAVIAISNILLMQDPLPSQLENLKTLKFSSQHLLHLINDILDYNKLISGQLSFDYSSFNFRFLLEGIIKTLAYSAQEKNIDLNLEIDKNIPQGTIGDSVRLSQVLTNLISNGIKFTSQGSVTLKVNLLKEEGKKIKLRFDIIDTGIGIQNDKLDYIFERFTQAESDTTKKYGGTGLGLAICKKILELQDTSIQVESELGKGTVFWFELEMEKVFKKDLIQINQKEEKTFNLEGINLLVVDDNPINLMVVKQFFTKWNIAHDQAMNGEEAVNMVKVNNYDIVLMDLQMPVMDGYTASREIRNLGGSYEKLPIIALSASVSNEVKEKVSQAGMNDYLGKPFDPVDLYEKLKHYSSISKPLIYS